jgi:AraC family ethanolamine operon transcriptional activator
MSEVQPGAGSHKSIDLKSFTIIISELSIRKPHESVKAMNDLLSEPVFPEGLVLDLITRDFEEMAYSAPRWDQEYLKLGKGTFKGHLLGFHTSRSQIGRVTWEPGILCRGSAPPRSITLAMLLNKGGATSFQGVVLEENHVVVMEPGQEFELSALGKSTLLVVALEEEWFRSYVQARWGEPFVPKNSRDRLVVRQRQNRAAIRQEWKKLLTDSTRRPSLLANSFFAESVEKEMLNLLLKNVLGPRPCPLGPSRRQAAKRAEEYLIANVRNPVSIADLCTAANANERTLLLGFREVFGTSPKAFLKYLRLNRVRQGLREATPGTSIAGVAFDWGITRLSRFAGDYRQMFNEYPHETMRKTLKKESN